MGRFFFLSIIKALQLGLPSELHVIVSCPSSPASLGEGTGCATTTGEAQRGWAAEADKAAPGSAFASIAVAETKALLLLRPLSDIFVILPIVRIELSLIVVLVLVVL